MSLVGNALPVGWTATSLGEVCLLNPAFFIKPVQDDSEISFVPMAAVEVRTGRMDSTQTRPYRDVRRGYTRFSEGDVLFAKITPSMENGKVALARDLANGSGCGSTEFHVLRPLHGISRNLLVFFLLQDNFRSEARRNMAGTAGQLRVPARFLDRAGLPLAPLAEQRRIVAEIEKHLTRLDASVAALKRVQANLKRYRASVLIGRLRVGGWYPTEAELARAEGRDYEPADRLLEAHPSQKAALDGGPRRNVEASTRSHQPRTCPHLPEPPEGWIWATVGQLSSRIEYGTSTKASSEPSGIPVLRMGNIQDGELNFSGP